MARIRIQSSGMKELPSGAKLYIGARMRVFREIVLLQDDGADWKESREAVAKVYEITEEDVLEIEREGIVRGWPPLHGKCP